MAGKRTAIISILSLLWIASSTVNALDDGVENLRQTGKAFASVARAVSPSVVFLEVEGKQVQQSPVPFQSPFGDDFFRRFFGQPMPSLPERPGSRPPRQERRSIGQGSGFVFAAKDGLLSDKSYIVTNNHVVEGAEKIRVRFKDGREFDARLTGGDPQSDVAVIEIDTKDVPALEVGDSGSLDIGEWVIAIGNPFGLSHTLTVGVVSATGRTSLGINDYEDFIQTDAAINPGNSGGPLVNLEGKVVGINTAIFSRSGGYMGVGFAIPIDLAKVIANQLIENGAVTRGFLGIVIQQLTPELAESFDIDPGTGILVAQVSEDSPAAQAGIEQGDVILEYGGESVRDVGSFRNRVSLTPPGEKRRLAVLRNGKRKTLTATIGKLTGDKLLSQDATQSSDKLGMTVQTLTPELAMQFGTEPGAGVVVTHVEPGSIAAGAAIEPGTVILQVNRQIVNSAADFKRALKAGAGDQRALLLVRIRDAQRFVVLNW